MTVLGLVLSTTAQDRFDKTVRHDSQLQVYRKKLQNGSGYYAEAERFAVRIGELLSEALIKAVEKETLVEFQKDLAIEFLAPLLRSVYEMIADACKNAQLALNRKAGINLDAVKFAFPGDRAANLAEKLSSYPTTEDSMWVLGEPVVSFCLNLVDEAVRVNAEALAAAGFLPRVRRISDSATCAFCNSHAGVYVPPLKADAFRRHERCRCLILLDVDSQYKPNADMQRLYSDANASARDARIARVLAVENKAARDG